MYVLLAGITVLSACKDDEAPEPENEVEVFTDVTLIFTNTANSSDVVEARAQDPDGVGVQELQILDEINLTADATYNLTFEILNALDADDVEDIGEEIKEEADEHQFFFSFTNSTFASPEGNGNRDNASDPINYNDTDGNGNPVGLSTSWTTSQEALSGGSFRVVLKHQPDIKSSSSGVNDGDSDFDLSFVLNIQ